MKTKIIKTYAHDYRDMKMSQDELKTFLEHFSKELLKAQRDKTKEIGDKMKIEDGEEFERISGFRFDTCSTEVIYNQAIKDYQTKIKSLK